MAMNHINKLWMDAESDLVEQVARKLCARHGSEIFGEEAVTTEFLNCRWRSFECDASRCIRCGEFMDAPKLTREGRRRKKSRRIID